MENEDDLQNLEEFSDKELRPEFVKQIKETRKKIFNKIKPKTMNGTVLNGKMLAELCKMYVDIVNSGAVPNIDSTWNSLVKNESYKLFKSSYFIFF